MFSTLKVMNLRNIQKKLIINFFVNQYLNKLSKPAFTVNFSTIKQQVDKQKKIKRRTIPQSSESLLKSFFSSRLTLTPYQLQNYLISLSKNGDVKIKDHRWQSLYMTIEKYHQQFSLDSKVQLLQSLGRMKQNNSLFITLFKDIVTKFHQLTLNQMAILLWSMVKAKQSDRSIVLAVYKKIHQLLNNKQLIKLYRANQQLPVQKNQQSSQQVNRQIEQQETNQYKIHHMHQANFTQLIWSIQSTTIIDTKLIIDLFKWTFRNQNLSLENLSKVRIQNLALLLYCITELEIEKYRISQQIIVQVMDQWKQIEKLGMLSLVLLVDSFSKFIYNQQHYLQRYAQNLQADEISKKQSFIERQKRFTLFIAEAIILKQDQAANKTSFENNKPFKKNLNQQQSSAYVPLKAPLSTKFASQIIFNLGKINLYQKSIWYKLLNSITHNVDQAEVQDLSMAITAICNLSMKQLPGQSYKQMLFQQKGILSKRIFQIYSSLSGKSLTTINSLIYERRIQNQFVPARIRKQVQRQYMYNKASQQSQEQVNNEKEKYKNEKKKVKYHNEYEKEYERKQEKEQAQSENKI